MLKFGFIGCGEAAGYHAVVVRSLGHTIEAVAARPNSPRMEAFARTHHISHQHVDWREMLEHHHLDALVVAVSWDQTFPLVRDLARLGIPALIEKPLALGSREVREIIKAAGQYGNRMMVGYNRRFYDFMPRVKEMVRELPLLSVEVNCPDPLRSLIKRYGDTMRESVLFFKTSHWIDLLLYTMNEVSVVKAYRQSTHGDGYYALLLGNGRVPIHFQARYDLPAQISLVFNFADLRCVVSPVERLRIYRGLNIVEATPEFPYRRYEPQLDEECLTSATLKPGYLEQMKYFVTSCVQGESAKQHGCTLESALKVTELCETLRDAQRL